MCIEKRNNIIFNSWMPKDTKDGGCEFKIDNVR